MLKVGTEVRGYRIEGMLGHGGMGTVYEARQISLDRLVALKVLSPELSMDTSFRERFRREGQIQAAIDHPNIVTVHEAGEIDEGLFIAMRIVRGPTLKDMIIARELEAARTLRILMPIADALDAAHGAGLIHRDIKPQNILVGARDHPFLADFGLTKGANEAGLTRTGQFVGTIDYISPEQIRGEPAQPASDLYALAAVLYECLTGVVPYTKPSDAAVLFAHMSDPRPLVTEKRPDLPPALNDVIVRGMDLDPSNRHTSGTELIEDAERAFGRRIRAALTPPGPIELPQEIGIREEEAKVPTRETRIREAAELADAVEAAETRAAQPVAPVEPPPPVADTRAAQPVAPVEPPPPVADTRAARPVAPVEPPPPEADAAPATDDAATTPASTGGSVPIAAAAAASAGAEADAPAVRHGRPVTAPTVPMDAAGGAPPTTETEARQRVNPLVPILLVAALVAIAVGFLIGQSGGDDAPEPEPLSGAAATADLGLNFPASSRRAAEPRAIPGLELTRPVGIEQTGAPGSGVVAGIADGGGATLLPAAFLKALPEAPKGEPVRLGSLSAYRYENLRPRGFDGEVTVYAVPTSLGVATIACYGPTGADDDAACERVASSLRLERGEPFALGPDTAYGTALRTTMTRLASRRTGLRERLAAAKTPDGQVSLAGDLATAYTTAAASLAEQEVSPQAADANAAVVAALRRTAGAYRDMAAAVRDERRAAYRTALTSVANGEKAVDAAIADLEPLGYTTS